jgi:hypothetical protein
LKPGYFAAPYANVTSRPPWGQLHALFECDSPEMRQMHESHRALAKVGIRRETVLLNGRPLSLERAGFNGILFEIQRELQTFGQLCMRERITTLRDIYVLEMLSRYMLVRQSFDAGVLDKRKSGWGWSTRRCRSRPDSPLPHPREILARPAIVSFRSPSQNVLS